MAATKSIKKGVKKRLKKNKQQRVSLGLRDVPALDQLIGNMLELNQWQNHLIQEARRRIKNLTADE